ncbi:L,D-transpeptidase [Cellulomonas massiliensis]|uniref:L,D-transpeptidase n=1 Tax=Cellulomonas massiliensis TaxID=1465811 RepID=UPI0003674494|nr:L,D-transpeptidase [Cellulomonas massiliensis]
MTSRGRPRRRTAAVSLVLLALAAGCGVPPDADPADPVAVRAVVVPDKRRAPEPPAAPDLSTLLVVEPRVVVPGLPGSEGAEPVRTDDGWQTVTVLRDTAAYDAPDGEAVGVLPALTLRYPTVLPVVGRESGWVRVMVAARGALPSQDASRVNHRTAWVRVRDTRAGSTSWRLTVDLSEQTLTVDDGERTRVLPVLATGRPGVTPTPRGLQFVVGPFWDEPGTTTPRVVLLSTQSETMDDYDRRTGTSASAIHTTTLRATGEVSNGCVRVTDEVLDVLWHRVPAGTLVDVVP